MAGDATVSCTVLYTAKLGCDLVRAASEGADGHGGCDPARSLALLWGVRRARRRPGRSDLSVRKIVLAAIGIADAECLSGLSMRRVAESLGVGVMSLYTYVPGKSELIDLMADTVYGEIARRPDPPGDWRCRLGAVARDNYTLFQRHPWLLSMPVARPLLGPHTLAKYEYELQAVAGAGLTEAEMDTVVGLVVHHAAGSARRLVEASRLERDTGMTDEHWWRVCAPLLGAVVDGDAFPTAVRVGSAVGAAHGTAYSAEHAFEFGLQRLLDGIDVLIRTRRS